jgi:hypothetical protein
MTPKAISRAKVDDLKGFSKDSKKPGSSDGISLPYGFECGIIPGIKCTERSQENREPLAWLCVNI